jgi:hypothetical protein
MPHKAKASHFPHPDVGAEAPTYLTRAGLKPVASKADVRSFFAQSPKLRGILLLN